MRPVTWSQSNVWKKNCDESFLGFQFVLILRKNIFAYLSSIHNTLSLLDYEQVCLSGLRFERSISRNGRSISQKVEMGEVSLET